jgi:hypothetical protein
VRSAVSEERVCNSCATCISHIISHETTQPSIHLRLVQDGDGSVVQEPITSCGADDRRDRQTQLRATSCGEHKRQSVCLASAAIFARVEAANHNCHSFHNSGHSAQSLGRVGLSSRHLPCDSRNTYRVSVRCVQNLESFSIDWCRYEVLSTPYLFSVSF